MIGIFGGGGGISDGGLASTPTPSRAKDSLRPAAEKKKLMLEAGYFPGVIPRLVWRAFVGASAQSTEKRWEGGASKEINAHLPLVRGFGLLRRLMTIRVEKGCGCLYIRRDHTPSCIYT